MNSSKFCLPLLLVVIFTIGLIAQEHPLGKTGRGEPLSQQRTENVKANHSKKNIYVPGQFIVGYKKGVSSRQIKSLHSEIGTRSKNYNSRLNIELVELGKSKLNIKAAMSRFSSRNSIVEYVEPNYIRQPYEFVKVPNDPEFINQWGMNNSTETNINILKAWNITHGSKDVVVGVIDTGIDYNHEDLQKNIWVNKAELNGSPDVDDDGNGYKDDIHGYDFGDEDGDPMDVFGHGTHVAGIIGAENGNSKGIAGVCKDVSLMAIRIDSEWGFADWAIVEAIGYATKMKVPVVNASWGSPEFGISLKKAIENYPGLFVVAAGNSLEEVHQVPQYPASYASENIICVGASDEKGKESSFSCFGYSGVDIFAPGVEILSCLPGESEYQYMSGTSMAAPFVSGVAALVLAKHPDISTERLMQHILVGSKNLNLRCASRGLLDAHGALTKLSTLGTKKLTVEIEKPAWAPGDLRWRWHGSRKLYKSGETVTVPRTELFVAHSNGLYDDFMGDSDYGTKVESGSSNTKVRYNYILPVKESNGNYKLKVSREKPQIDISKNGKVFNRYPGYQAGLVKLKTKKTSIGFPFKFYGKAYNKVILTETGHLVFSKLQYKTGNTIFPRQVPNDETIIAPIWTPAAYSCYSDFKPEIYYKKLGKPGKKQFVVQYEFKETTNHFAFAWVSTCKVQVVLNQEDNSFKIYYSHLAPLNHTHKTRGVYGAVWDGEKSAPIWLNPSYSRVLGGDLCLTFNATNKAGKPAATPSVVCESSSIVNRSGNLYLKAVFSHPDGAKNIDKASLYLYSYMVSSTAGLVINYDRKQNTLGINDYQRNSFRANKASSGKKLKNWFGYFVPSQFKIKSKGKKLTIEGPVTVYKGHTGVMKLYAGCEDNDENYTGICNTGKAALLDHNYGSAHRPAIDEFKYVSVGKGKGSLEITVSDADGATDITDIVFTLTHTKEPEVEWFGYPMKPATTIYYMPAFDWMRVHDDRYYYENIFEQKDINWDDSAVLNNSSVVDLPKFAINSSDVEKIRKGKKLTLKIPFKFTKNMKRGVYDVNIEVYDVYAMEYDYLGIVTKEIQIEIK